MRRIAIRLIDIIMLAFLLASILSAKKASAALKDTAAIPAAKNSLHLLLEDLNNLE